MNLRFLNPAADDPRMLTVTRAAAAGCGVAAIAITIASPTIIGVIGIFFALLSVSLFVSILAGLYARRAGTPEAFASIAAGVATMVAAQLTTEGRAVYRMTPALLGIVAASIGFGVVFLSRVRMYEPQQAV